MRFFNSRLGASAKILAALAVAGVAAPGSAFAAAGDASVTVKNFDFHPMAVTVPAGATVTWKNMDGEPHSVTSVDGAFRSPALDEDDTYSFKFTKPGVYKYLCTIHPRMTASVTVK